MDDLFHNFGADLSASATGDLQTVSGVERGKQRILRRLLTNPRKVMADGSIRPPDYLFHPEYGAGLPSYVGSVIDVRQINALIRGQIMLEDVVAKTPAPAINVQAIQNGMSIDIQYTDSETNTVQFLSFNVTK